MKQKFEWKISGLAKGLNANVVAKEFERITAVYGVLTAETVLSEAEKRKSPLHAAFEWDDTVAARKWRLEQARKLINNVHIKIISSGEETTIGAYEIVNVGDARGFKNISLLTEEESEEVRDNCKRDLTYIKIKLSMFNAFQKATQHIDNAVMELNKV